MEARVWPTLELIIVESPRHLQRKTDEETGLALIDLDASPGGFMTGVSEETPLK